MKTVLIILGCIIAVIIGVLSIDFFIWLYWKIRYWLIKRK